MSRTDESLYSDAEAEFDDYRSRQPHAVPAPAVETITDIDRPGPDPAEPSPAPALFRRKAS